MDKGTGQTCAVMLPLWADGGILLVPVPLSALFMVRQQPLAAPCEQPRRLSPNSNSLSFSQAYESRSVSSYSLRSGPASFARGLLLLSSGNGITASSQHLSQPL